MSFFGKHRRQNPQVLEIDPAVTINNQNDVLATIDSLGLPREKIIVVGSAALTLIGLDRYANDVDLVAHPDILQTLESTHRLPSGMAVRGNRKRSNFIQFQAATEPLPTELFSPQQTLTGSSFEDAFQFTVQGPDGLKLASPSELLSKKQTSVRILDNEQDRRKKHTQDIYDTTLLVNYLQNRYK